jgi:ABC-type amino acid transport substrate-binding protein
MIVFNSRDAERADNIHYALKRHPRFMRGSGLPDKGSAKSGCPHPPLPFGLRRTGKAGMTRFLILCVLCASAVLLLVSSAAFAADKGTAYERVMNSGEIKCGYGTGAPLVVVDPNTGEVSGIMRDIMDEIGKALNVRIVWTEEVPWGQLATALQSKRVDVICSSMWASAGRGKYIAFTNPLFFSRIDAFVRADDKRFDNDPSRINREDVRIIIEEGDVTEEIARNKFPKARHVTKPQLAGDEYHFLALEGNKADIVLLNASYAMDYAKINPDTIRKVPLLRPLQIYSNVLGVDIEEQKLRDMMNAAVDQLLYSGTIERIIKKYEDEYPEVFLHVSEPYK